VTTTQELSMSLTRGAAAAEPAVQMLTEMALGYLQTNGGFDDQGRMASQLTIERFDLKQSYNGTARSVGDTGPELGRSVTAVFDREGKFVDLKVPKELEHASGVLKQLLASAYGAVNFLPATAMSVGESATVPFTIPVRLSTTTPVPYQARTVTTLRSIEKNGEDRVAHFEQRIESAAETEALLKVSGSGTIDVNLDRGFVAASATEWSITGDGALAGGALAEPGGVVRSTIRVTVAAHE
jgi:hypothetical protein